MEQDEHLWTVHRNLTTSNKFLYEEWPRWPFTRLNQRQMDHLERKKRKQDRVEKLDRIINAEDAPF